MNDTNWLERASASLTRENWLRHRDTLEMIAAVLVFLISALASLGGAFAVGLLLSLAVGAATFLHRRAPLVALIAVTATLIAFVGFWTSDYYWGITGGSTVMFFLTSLLVLFGCSLYGVAPVPWLAAGYILLATVLMGSLAQGAGVGAVLGSALTVGAIMTLAWALGWVIRATVQRRSAVTTSNAVVAQRDELEVSVAMEQERNRVARDVHDIVAHSLAVVIAQADGARYAARKAPESVDGALEAISATARAALIDVRSLLTDLRHSQEPGPQPGMNDIDALIRGFRESGLEVNWSSYGIGHPVSEATGLGVYRIVQESLTNALRHGTRTSPVDLEFDWSETALSITVTNDLPAGERVANAAGHGIPGMRERATLAGGAFTTGDGTNGRFRIRAVLPVDRGNARTQPMAALRTSPPRTATP